MRTIIELDGKKISKKAASEKFGKEEMDRIEYSAVGVPPVRQGVPFVRRGVPLAIFR